MAKSEKKSKGLKLIGVLLALALLLTLVLSATGGCSSSSRSEEYSLVTEGKLTVAASLDYSPFEHLEGDTSTGYSIAVIQEAANRLGLECEIKEVPSNNIISTIASGTQCDVGVAPLTITDQRKEQVDFSTPYYYVDQAIVIRGATFETVEELADLPVVALTNSSSFDYATNSVSSKVVSRTSIQDCFELLQTGAVQAVVTEYPVAKALTTSYSNCEILERITTSEGYGIAVNKSNQSLTEAINEALASMEEDGTLDNLQQQYLS